MIPLKAVLAHASTSWDGAWPVEPLDITVWEKVFYSFFFQFYIHNEANLERDMIYVYESIMWPGLRTRIYACSYFFIYRQICKFETVKDLSILK